VSGARDERVGGPPQEINGEANKKRTVYARIRRSSGKGILGLFDFSDPTLSGDQRSVTNVPLQGLFFLNSDLMWREAGRFADRLKAEAPDDAGRIRRAYRLLYGRPASEMELKRGLAFLEGEKTGWQQYAQALLSLGEFLYLNSNILISQDRAETAAQACTDWRSPRAGALSATAARAQAFPRHHKDDCLPRRNRHGLGAARTARP